MREDDNSHRERVERALRTVAALVAQPGGEVYLPIFERLERELAAIEIQDRALERARALARVTPTRG